MASTQIGAQLFTLREHLKTPSDIAATLKRVKEMGYDAVQVSAVGPIETEELAKILRNEGLVCAATHQGLDKMKDTQACVDYHKALGCKYTAIGGFFEKDLTVARLKEFARDYSQVAKTLAEHGIRVGYHNHNHEFFKYDGKTAMEWLIEFTDPEVWFEIDTYWVQAGGGDPAQWIDKVAGRVPCVHFKDMFGGKDMQPVMCEVGSGNLNWPRILDSCKNAGVEWYLVERDRGDLDPFESLKISLDNMKSWGLK